MKSLLLGFNLVSSIATPEFQKKPWQKFSQASQRRATYKTSLHIVLALLLVSPQLASADNVLTNISAYLARETPSKDYSVVQYGWIRLSYPANWQLASTQTGWLVIGPQFGIMHHAVGCGIVIGSYSTPLPPDESLSKLIKTFKKMTPGGLHAMGQEQKLIVAGRPALSREYESASPLSHGFLRAKERDKLIVLYRSDNAPIWIVLVALEQDYAFLRSTFDRIIDSIRIATLNARYGISQDTDITIKLKTELSTAVSRKGDLITAEIINPKALAGDLIEGHIVSATSAGTASSLTLEFDVLRHDRLIRWITASVISWTNSMGQTSIAENGIGVSFRNTTGGLPIVSTPPEDPPWQVGRRQWIFKKSAEFGKLITAVLTSNSRHFSLAAGSEFILRISPSPETQ